MDLKKSSELTAQKGASALAYLMFLKQKRTGEVVRGCADGRPQHDYMTKEENSAPTVSVEALLLSYTIDAMEERDISIDDIPQAFMQADMNETAHLKVEGRLA